MKRISLCAFALSLLIAVSSLSAYPAYVRVLPVLHSGNTRPLPLMNSGRLQSGAYLTSIGQKSWLPSILYGNATAHSVRPISITYDPANPNTFNWTFNRGGGGGYVGDLFTFYIRLVDPTDAALMASDSKFTISYETLSPPSLSYDSRSTNPNRWVQLTDSSGKPCYASYGGLNIQYSTSYSSSTYSVKGDAFKTVSGMILSPNIYDEAVAGLGVKAVQSFFPKNSSGKTITAPIPDFAGTLAPIFPKGSSAYINAYNSAMASALPGLKTAYTTAGKTWTGTGWQPLYPSSEIIDLFGGNAVVSSTTTLSVGASGPVSGSFTFNPSFISPGSQYELIAESCDFQDTSQQSICGTIGWQKLGLLGITRSTSTSITISAQTVPQDDYKVWFNSSDTISTSVIVQ